MKEEEIRPSNLMRENQQLRAEDAAELIKNKDEFVLVPCPACQSENYEKKFVKEGFDFVICNDCETYFINPRPTFEILNRFYENSKCLKHWKKFFQATEESRKKNIFEPRSKRVIDICKKHNKSEGILLDVGAGSGTLCEIIQEQGNFKKVIAVEPSNDLAEECRKKNVDVIEKPIEKIALDSVDVITSFELIEHLFNPKEYILACAKALSKDGLFILTTPNIKGFDLLVLGKASTNIAGPNHINYFHPESLSNLLHNCGLEVIETLTPGELDAELVHKKILDKEFDISNQPFLQNVLVNQWEKLGDNFQKFLSSNGLSSHMWIVAKKI